MPLTLDDFVTKYSGEAVSFDGIPENTGQCLQLVAFYNQQVIGAPSFYTQAAQDWFLKFRGSPLEPYYLEIPYNAGYAKAGDIVIWGASPAINSPKYGHIDICITDGGDTGFIGFDSNWGGVIDSNGYPAAHTVAHTYTAVLGYLRPKTVLEATNLKKGEPMIDTNHVEALYRDMAFREPTPEELNDAVGQVTTDQMVEDLDARTAADQRIVKIREWGPRAVDENWPQQMQDMIDKINALQTSHNANGNISADEINSLVEQASALANSIKNLNKGS